MVVEPTCKQHQRRHNQGTDRCGIELGGAGETGSPPELEQTGSDLDTVEAATHITVKDFLTKNRPNNLCTGFNSGGIG